MMPLRKKLLCCLSSFLILTMVTVSPVSAFSKEEGISNDEFVVDSEIHSTIYNGQEYFFANEEDKTNFINDHKARAYNYSDKLVASSKRNYGYIGALSVYNTWNNAISYTLSAGQSYSASSSISYEGFTVGINYTKSFSSSTTYGATENLLSKLGTWRTYTLSKYLTTVTDEMGHFVRSYYSVTTVYSGDGIISACYQSGSPKCGIGYYEN